MTVKNYLTDYSDNNLVGKRRIEVSSADFGRSKVVITIGGESAELVADELIKAVQNATNVPI